LFVWTVFSPKYLYAVGWAVGMHLAVNVGLGGVLFWFGCKV
jgi:ethanolaminephosphotransferase